MGDVLFDFGKYNLKPDTKITLAKLAGIIQSHPGLHLAIEGHTDNIGSDEANMKLSQQRGDTVRDFLVQQGLAADTVTAVGLGKAEPVADNSTNEGRQKNRRVEIIVSGDAIGAKTGYATATSSRSNSTCLVSRNWSIIALRHLSGPSWIRSQCNNDFFTSLPVGSSELPPLIRLNS